MSFILCFLWWILLGALLGWLASWALGRRRQAEIVSQIVEKPIEHIVETIVDKPMHLARVETLEEEAALVPALREEIALLRAMAPVTIEKIVERPVDRVVKERVPDTQAIEEREARLRDLQRRHDALESELVRLRRGPAPDIAAARAAGFSVKSAEDLEIIEGVGPKIAELLHKEGIATFALLVDTSPATIRDILERAGPSFKIADPATWPEQADLAARNRWGQLKSLQDELVAGVRVAMSDSGAEIRDLKAQLSKRDEELRRLKEPAAIDTASARAAGFSVKGPYDLEVIEGVGPKIAELLNANGVRTFSQLAAMAPTDIEPILDKAGPSFRIAKPDTWPEQADLAARNHWRALFLLQQSLTGGQRQGG